MSDDNKVVNLADVSDSPQHWSPAQMLENELELIEDGKAVSKAMFIYTSGDTNEDYTIGYSNSQLTMSEMIVILELTKMRLIAEMGGI